MNSAPSNYLQLVIHTARKCSSATKSMKHGKLKWIMAANRHPTHQKIQYSANTPAWIKCLCVCEKTANSEQFQLATEKKLILIKLTKITNRLLSAFQELQALSTGDSIVTVFKQSKTENVDFKWEFYVFVCYANEVCGVRFDANFQKRKYIRFMNSINSKRFLHYTTMAAATTAHITILLSILM